MKLHKIIKYLEKKFPINKAEIWDKVGFQKFNNKFKDPNLEISNVLICMEITKSVLESIKSNMPQLIITRHPFIFNELNKEKLSASKKNIIKFLTKNNIIVYSIHTNYDYCASNVFIEELSTVLKIKTASTSFSKKGPLNVKLFETTSIIDIINQLMKCFNSTHVEINSHVDVNIKINSFMINQGSGASAMLENELSNTVFITGEAKWNDWIYANDNNVILLTIGHYMENYFIKDICKRLKKNFSTLLITTFDIDNQYKVI